MFFKKRKAAPQGFAAPLAPEVPFYAIGDIHGCDGLLQKLIGQLQEAAHPSAVLVCVGDYIDRGEESAAVLRRLYEMQTGAPEFMTCLMGNHEHMMLRFFEDPKAHGARWLRYGGLQTLASFSITGLPGADAADKEWLDLRSRVADAMGDDLLAWLRKLPSHWQSGNVHVVHAGADPDLPVATQDRSTLLWGHAEFAKKQRGDGQWIVHGHTIVDKAQAKDGRISIDTGAYATGHLTAALVEIGKISFVTT